MYTKVECFTPEGYPARTRADNILVVEPGQIKAKAITDRLGDASIVVKRTEDQTTVWRLSQPKHVMLADRIDAPELQEPKNELQERLAANHRAELETACEMAQVIGEFSIKGSGDEYKVVSRINLHPMLLAVEHF